MQKPNLKAVKPPHDVYEWVVGGDGDEFTIVCHPADGAKTPADDIRATPGPDLVCKLVETKDRPAH